MHAPAISGLEPRTRATAPRWQVECIHDLGDLYELRDAWRGRAAVTRSSRPIWR
jgi:hypothetical protein